MMSTGPPLDRISKIGDRQRNCDVDYEAVNDEVEAEDVDGSSSPTLVKQILSQMHPSQCLAPECGTNLASSLNILDDDNVDVEEFVTNLLDSLQTEGKSRTVALQKLYRFTSKERHENRIAVVCTTRFNLVDALIPSLSIEGSSNTDRRQALLLVNNLCIPVENKAAIMLGDFHVQLLPALLTLVRARQPESYLAIVSLFNLSFLPEAKSIMFRYVPPSPKGQSEYRHYKPLENPISLLQTLISLVKDYLPFITNNAETTKVLSVEGEVVRWSMGLMRNLATIKENSVAIAYDTIFPQAAIETLEASLDHDKDLGLWKRGSLEDSSLMLLVHLAQQDCLQALRSDQTLRVLKRLKGKGGIHETRAMALTRLLELPIEKEEVKDDSKSEKSEKFKTIRIEEKKEWV